MSTENETPVDPVTDDLEAFTDELFGRKTPEAEPASPAEPEKADTEEDALDEDTHSGEEDTPAEDADTDEGPEAEAKDKPKKNSVQERINEVTAKYREEQRARQALEAKFEELSKKLEQNTPPPKPAKVDEGPTPDAVLEDGTEKYPLGEFDPNYIRDLTKFTIQQEREASKAEEARQAQQTETQKAKAELQSSWEAKLAPAQERYPDFHEKGQELISSFDGIEANYGEYLSSTIMSLDYGTDVLYYLANHPDEAKKIVQSGATKATIALGRIEAKFAMADDEKTKARPKVSKAPEPPAHLNKGSSVSKPSVEDDTDDLDAFQAKFFKPKKGYNRR